MAELRQGKFGDYYGTPFTASKALTADQQKINATYIYSYFTDKGWSINAISAMLGNMQVESALNPGRWQNDSVGSYSLGYGLVQWTPATNYIDWCTSENRSDASEMDNNLDRIIYELENGLQYYKTPTYNFSFKTFSTSTKDVQYLAVAFLKNYERAGSEKIALRKEYAQNWYNFLANVTPEEPEENKNKEIIDKAVNWAVGIANDDTHGYTQDMDGRWHPDYDCSSFIITAFEQAGCPVKTNGATYTGNMISVFTSTGFTVLNYSQGMELVKGDVLWKDGHTEMYIGNNQNVGAHINELGETTGGQTGDQTGHEISVTGSPNGNWTKVLRLPQTGGSSGGDNESPTGNPSIYRSKLAKILLYAIATDEI